MEPKKEFITQKITSEDRRSVFYCKIKCKKTRDFRIDIDNVNNDNWWGAGGVCVKDVTETEGNLS